MLACGINILDQIGTAGVCPITGKKQETCACWGTGSRTKICAATKSRAINDYIISLNQIRLWCRFQANTL
jgi:hypothetical protein